MAAQIYQPVEFGSLLLFGAVILGVFAVSLGAALLAKRRCSVFQWRYAPRSEAERTTPVGSKNGYKLAASLLTNTETRFYKELHRATGPMAVIQCKVRLADILLAPEGNLGAFRQVSQKHLDFLLCEQVTLKPLLAIELDDPSHERPNRKARDRFVDSAYTEANLPIIHITTQNEYNPAALLKIIQPYLIYEPNLIS